MSTRKVIKISWIILLIVIVPFTLLSFMFVGETHRAGTLSVTVQEAEMKHSIVAKYEFSDTANSSLVNMLQQELFLERMSVRERYKYIYYSPAHYSEEFYANESVFVSSRITHRDSSWTEFENYRNNNFMIVGERDTLFKSDGCFFGIKSIPQILKVYTNGIHIGNFRLKYLYKENLENPPTPSVLERFSLGPLFDKDYD